MTNNNSIALFDFDGTITNRDSFLSFLKFSSGTLKYYSGLLILSPFIFLYFLKIVEDFRLKKIFLKFFLKGKTLINLKKKAQSFNQEILPGLIRPGAIKRIEWHKSQGHQLVMVSASADLWLKDFSKSLGFVLISTKLEIKDNRVTGNLLGENCKGPEKVNKIRENFNLDEYSKIYAYGDSSGDDEMLALADKSFYKPFRDL